MIGDTLPKALGAACLVLGIMVGVQTLRLLSAQADLASEQRDHATAMASAQAKARQTESELRADNDRLQSEAATLKADHEKAVDSLVDAVRTGQRRLSVAAVCPSASGGSAATPGGRGPQTARAELDTAASERILRIGGDGDQAIIERNTCVEAYEKVRARLNQARQAQE